MCRVVPPLQFWIAGKATICCLIPPWSGLSFSAMDIPVFVICCMNSNACYVKLACEYSGILCIFSFPTSHQYLPVLTGNAFFNTWYSHIVEVLGAKLRAQKICNSTSLPRKGQSGETRLFSIHLFTLIQPNPQTLPFSICTAITLSSFFLPLNAYINTNAKWVLCIGREKPVLCSSFLWKCGKLPPLMIWCSRHVLSRTVLLR